MKGQFFIVSAVVIVFILFSLSLFIQQFSTIDAVGFLNLEEVRLAKNVLTKIVQLNKTNLPCNEFRYYLKDFLETTKELYKDRLIRFDYYINFTSSNCNNTIYIFINSTRINITASKILNR